MYLAHSSRKFPAGLPIAEGVRHALSGERKYWPSDGALRKAARTRPFYFQGRQEQKMLIFQRLEESYTRGTAGLGGGDAVEHVMPQSLSDDWRAALEKSVISPTRCTLSSCIEGEPHRNGVQRTTLEQPV